MWLSDAALGVAPAEITGDLRIVRESFDRMAENDSPTGEDRRRADEAAERLVAYNERVCGFPLYLGSTD